MIGGITQIVSLGVAASATAGIGLFGAFMLVTVVKETMNRQVGWAETTKR